MSPHHHSAPVRRSSTYIAFCHFTFLSLVLVFSLPLFCYYYNHCDTTTTRMKNANAAAVFLLLVVVVVWW